MHHSVSQHREAVRELLAPLLELGRTQRLPLREALGRGLAQDVIAPMSLPPFANSQMDGFAVRSTDVSEASPDVPDTSALFPDGGALLRVVAPIPAGGVPAALEPGTAAPIMTGAMMPSGADAVVPVERALPDTFPEPGTMATVHLPAAAPGVFVRSAGSDIARGQLALAAGTFLGPGQLGLLAALGIPEVTVHVQLTVLLVTTGAEVVEPGRPLAAGQVYDANGTLLESAMRLAGIKVVRAGISSDSPADLLAVLRERASGVDLMVTTGGVSQGAYEVVRQAMEGQDVRFLHVSLQPGGPQGIGMFCGVPFLGFPGNPVSCLVSFEMFLRPVVGELFGSPAPRLAVRARLLAPLSSPFAKYQLRRGLLLPDGTVWLEGGVGSHLVHALAGSNALVHVPVGISALAVGDEVEVWML